MTSLDELKDHTMNRRKYDGCKTDDDLRVATGPGRYQLDAPNGYCDACFVPEPTTRQQRWGASLNKDFIKTDVESDLFNINRPTTKASCNQYNPEKNKMNNAAPLPVKECSFPQVFSRLVDPPCNNRAVGWNRWEWLCDNPQASVMLPFDNMVTTRLQKKDEHRPCIPTPISANSLLPAPSSIEAESEYDGVDSIGLPLINDEMNNAFKQFDNTGSAHAPAPAGFEGYTMPSSLPISSF